MAKETLDTSGRQQIVVENRWDENAGLQAGCDKLPMTNALEAQ